MQGVGNITNDRNETKPRRPQIKTYARLWKSVWLASAIIVAMALALACQEQEPSGQQGTINLIRDCNKKLRISLIVQREIETAERGNEIVQAYQEVTHLDCGPDTWSAKISSTPQSCVPRQLYLPICRQLVLPIDLLLLAALLGRAGAVAGDVKLQDDGVMDHPVNRRGGGHGVGEDALPLREDQV